MDTLENMSGLYDRIRAEYSIDESLYRSESIKRGLRNADGSGVIVGVTKIGSVLGYVIQDGEKTLLYLHDGGAPFEETYECFRKNGFKFDIISYDFQGHSFSLHILSVLTNVCFAA